MGVDVDLHEIANLPNYTVKWSRIQIRDFCNEMINVRIFFLYVHLFTWTGCVGSHAWVILKCSSTKCDHFLTEQLIQNLLITTTWQLVPSFVLTKTNSVHVLIYFLFSSLTQSKNYARNFMYQWGITQGQVLHWKPAQTLLSWPAKTGLAPTWLFPRFPVQQKQHSFDVE